MIGIPGGLLFRRSRGSYGFSTRFRTLEQTQWHLGSVVCVVRCVRLVRQLQGGGVRLAVFSVAGAAVVMVFQSHSTVGLWHCDSGLCSMTFEVLHPRVVSLATLLT